MSKVQMLRALVKQRLTAAAEDIFGLFERTIAEYEETLCRSKEENERQRRLLDAVFNPQLRLHRAAADDESTAASGPGVTSQETTADNVADVEQLLVNKEEVPAEHQQEWSPSLDQEDPEPPHIKEEQEEVWTNPEQEQLQGLEEVKEKEDEEKPQSSQLHQRQTEQMKTEADGDDCGGPEPDRNSHPDTEDKTEETEVSDVQMLRALVKQRLTAAAEDIFGLFERTIAEYEETLCRSKEENERQRRLLDAVFNPQLRLHRADFQQLSLTKEEVPPEQQQEEWSSSLDQEDLPELRHIKEEQEEVLTSQEEEQLQELEEADLTKFTFTPVPVKSEEDAEEKSQSSQLHKRQTEQMKTEVDGEDCQGPQPEPHPDTHLQPVSEDSDDNDDWKESQEPQSGLNFPKNKGYNSFGKGFRCSLCGKQFCSRSNLNIHMRIHTGEKPFSCLVCGKRFIQMTHLQSHLKFHTREKPYSCTLCNIFFSQSDILLSHLKTHTREKPFSCNVCHKSFTRRHLVKRHKCGGESRRQTEQMETEADGEDCREPGPVRNLHPNTHLTPDTNDKIEESSESETDVSDGDWRETREPQSGLNFKKNTEVPVSQMTFTTAEKQFLLHTCSECGKMFGNKPNLNVHMRIHTVEKPFICLVCGKIFERGEDLRQHMVVHPGKKK